MTNVVADGVANALCVGTSCRTGCMLTGFEPPLCRAGTIVVELEVLRARVEHRI